jgi:hypothetical protein
MFMAPAIFCASVFHSGRPDITEEMWKSALASSVGPCVVLPPSARICLRNSAVVCADTPAWVWMRVMACWNLLASLTATAPRPTIGAVMPWDIAWPAVRIDSPMWRICSPDLTAL